MWHMGGIKTSKIPLALSWEIEIQHPVIETKYNQSIEISTSWTQIEDTYSSHGDFSITQAKNTQLRDMQHCDGGTIGNKSQRTITIRIIRSRW